MEIIREGEFYRARSAARVGPMVKNQLGDWAIGGLSLSWSSMGICFQGNRDMDLIGEWPEHLRVDHIETPSPIRIKTVTEIVSGVYGRVSVGVVENGQVDVLITRGDSHIHAPISADELDAAAIVFTQLAGALREMAK